MWFLALAVLLGLVAGKLRGGSGSEIAARDLRWVTLLMLGLAAHLLTSGLDLADASIPLVLSYVLLGAFAVANLRVTGMPIFLVGLALNFAPLVVNDGMPVRPEAVVAANVASPADLDAVDLGAGRHLETSDDAIRVLGDIVPIAPLRAIVSFGDLILAAGLADVVANLMLPSRRRQRRLPERRGRTRHDELTNEALPELWPVDPHEWLGDDDELVGLHRSEPLAPSGAATQTFDGP
jgi:hypothetical protein